MAGGLPSSRGRGQRERRCARRSGPWSAVCGQGWKDEAPVPPKGAPPPEGWAPQKVRVPANGGRQPVQYRKPWRHCR